MRIAFDAKRAFQNNTGLGNYSRLLINSMAAYYPAHDYYLMAPRLTSLYSPPTGAQLVTPRGIDRTFSSLWRSNRVKTDLTKLDIDLYHGLSHEIPLHLHKTGIRSVVTIHDLIFERYPQQYKPLDARIYRAKFQYACHNADKVIAISEQTKHDIIEFYKVPAEKISVCYQCVDPAFEQIVGPEQLKAVKERYEVPDTYLLYVGSIIERKNLLNICKALQALKGKLDIPLVIIGSGNGAYAQSVKEYIHHQGMQQQVIFMEEKAAAQNPSFKNAIDFPAIYQAADMVIYPSVYEGFGLPVLEALWSKVPVITSNLSCLPETGGDAACYIDPHSVDEMAASIFKVHTDKTLRQQMVDKGVLHARKFAPKACAENVMRVYESLF